MSMALAALGIDLMLPAFGVMRADLGLAENSNALTGLITAYFLGLATGQLLYGPLADRFGRRPILFLGYGIYAVGAAAGAVAPSLGLILVGTLRVGARRGRTARGDAGDRPRPLAGRADGPGHVADPGGVHRRAGVRPDTRVGLHRLRVLARAVRRLRAGRRGDDPVGHPSAARDPGRGAPSQPAVPPRARGRPRGGHPPPDGRLHPGDDRAVRRVHLLPRVVGGDLQQGVRRPRHLPVPVRRPGRGHGGVHAGERPCRRTHRHPPVRARCPAGLPRRRGADRRHRGWPRAGPRRCGCSCWPWA